MAVIGEADILKSLNHPNVMAFKDFFILKNHLCIVTEQLSMNCLIYLKDNFGDLNEYQRKSIFYNTIKALAYCHKQGIMHRDLKLDNILVTVGDDGHTIKELKLADFGMACRI